MHIGAVEFKLLIEDSDFDVEAFIEGFRVGHAWGIRDGDRLNLTDIEVQAIQSRRYSRLRRLLPWLFPEVRLRRKGIGTELLRQFLGRAEAEGIREVWGCVVEKDLKEWPGLIAWYERHGFVVIDPDFECRVKAIKKIVRRRT